MCYAFVYVPLTQLNIHFHPERHGIFVDIQVSPIPLPPVTPTILTTPSLTQEASLREVEMLREQIYRIKGGDTVRVSLSPAAANL